MIKVLFGKRGMGKTKQMREWANNRIADARGTVVFIDKDNDHMYELDRNIRFINAVDYGVAGCEMLTGFICGIAARDFDLEAVFINSFAKLVDKPAAELEPMFAMLESFSEKAGVDVFISMNDGGAPCPEYLKKYC